MSDTDNKTVELLREISIQISNDPEAKKRFMRTILGDDKADTMRAVLSGPHSRVASYYKEDFAKELIPLLDSMIADKEDREVRFEDYPRLNKATIYLKVYWSWAYLIDCLDIDGKYQKLRNDTQITRKRSGILIYFTGNINPLLAHKVDKMDRPAFRRKIDTYLTDGKEGDMLELTKISISDQEVADLKAMLTGIENLVWIVTGTRIKLVKVTEAEYKQWLGV